MQFKVNRCYETWDHESIEAGDTDDRGFTYQDEVYTLRDLVNEMRRDAITEPSSSSPHAGMWFTSVDPDEDYRTGERTYHSIHLTRVDGSAVDTRTMKRIIRLIDYKIMLWN